MVLDTASGGRIVRNQAVRTLYSAETQDQISRPATRGPFHFSLKDLMDRSAARQKYASHKANAARRGIEFDLTFEEWLEIWGPRLEQRGRHTDQLGMCRTRDQGGYADGNVRLDTPKGNSGDRVLMRRRPWHAYDAGGARGAAIADSGFKSYANTFLRPDRALELAQEEYEWIPGE